MFVDIRARITDLAPEIPKRCAKPDWTSGFVHAHWGAVRDTNFVICRNPRQHRLHRIPRFIANSVEDDALSLINDMIARLDQLSYRADATRDGNGWGY